MLKVCSRTLMKVGMVNHYHLVKPVPAVLVPGRYLTEQKGLPRMPVPPLQQTCELYVAALEPVVEPDELKRTKQLVEEFQKAGGVGERLQKGLERRARTTDNWLTEYLLRTDYLENRSSLVAYSNVGCTFLQMDFRDKQGQIRYAAKMVATVLDYKTLIENDMIPAEYIGKKPLCMQQFPMMLSFCRIPGPEIDTVVYHGQSANPPTHITVVHNSQFFVLEVYHSDGTPLTVDQLCVQLERICSASPETTTEPVGVLTTLDRDSWSRSYISLIEDKTNKESVSAIERSIFTLCLDGALPPVSDEPYSSSPALQMMHGGGSEWNSANRWFDKSLQIIVGENGFCGFNMAHVAADGTVFMSMADYVVTNMEKKEMNQSPMVHLPVPQKLHFNITADTKRNIEEAKRSMDLIAQDIDLRVMVFRHFGRSLMRTLKISGDGFVQLAIQLAYYRMHKQCGMSYEAASLRMFPQGRVGLVLSTSTASVNFVKAFDDSKKQNTEKMDLMDKALKVHRANTKITHSGQDADSHLIGLRMQAIEENISMPDLFTDVSYNKFLVYSICSSQVSSKTGSLPQASHTQPGTYSITYSIMDNDITILMSICNSYKLNNAIQMMHSLEMALLDIRTLLQQTPRKN